AGIAAWARRLPPCRSRRSSRCCCASMSLRWHSRPRATATTIPRWWCNWRSRRSFATGSGKKDHELPDRSRLGFVSGPRHVRTRGPRLLPRTETGQGRDHRLRATRRGPRGDQAGRSGLSHPSTIHQGKRGLTTMASFERAELDEWVQSWLQANKDCEKSGDWTPLADFYAPDATYGWNIGPKEDVMCVGIDEIRDIALGFEMEGLEDWQYPYQKVIIDDRQGEIVGFWKQVVIDGEGGRQEIYGIGGSWFRL